MNTDAVKGFKDYLGEDAEKREEIRKILVETFESYGFEPAETPVIEYEEFVRGDNENDEAVSDIFKLEDKGKRKLALRYELTFPLKRIMNNKKLPYKRYQIGPVFRDEPISANRFRQFIQCDVDIIGSGVKEDAEILKITSELFGKLKIENEIFVGNRALLNEILEEQGIIKNKEQVLREIDKLDKLNEKEVKNNLKEYNAEKIIDILKKPEKFFEKYSAYADIKELKKICDYYGIKIIFQPSLVRGLSYYNKNVWEVRTKQMKETISGGGSYIFNDVQCTGISFGIERLCQIVKIDLQKEKFLVISLGKDKEGINLVDKIRKNGKITGIYYGKPSKALDYANSYNFNKIIFVGEKEMKSKKFMVKDMKTGKESLLKI